MLVILLLFALGVAEPRWLARQHVPSFAAVSVLMIVDIGCTNLAISVLSVSLQQCIKAAMPVCVMLFERLLQGKTPRPRVLEMLVPLTFGPVLAALGSGALDFSWRGVGLMSVAVLTAAGKAVLTHKIIKQVRREMGMVAFLFWLEVALMAGLVPWCALNGELLAVGAWAGLRSPAAWGAVTFVALMGGARAYACNLVLKEGSALLLASANVLIQMAAIFGSVVIFDTEVSSQLLIGIVTTLTGFAGYTAASHQAKQAELAERHATSPPAPPRPRKRGASSAEGASCLRAATIVPPSWPSYGAADSEPAPTSPPSLPGAGLAPLGKHVLTSLGTRELCLST